MVPFEQMPTLHEPPLQTEHAAPPTPQASSAEPVLHSPLAEQQPVAHELASHFLVHPGIAATAKPRASPKKAHRNSARFMVSVSQEPMNHGARGP
jgi:hypothetical protein